jgi:hypothetical protein
VIKDGQVLMFRDEKGVTGTETSVINYYKKVEEKLSRRLSARSRRKAFFPRWRRLSSRFC